MSPTRSKPSPDFLHSLLLKVIEGNCLVFEEVGALGVLVAPACCWNQRTRRRS